MAPRRLPETGIDAVDEVVADENTKDAGDLSEALDMLRGFTGSSVKVIVYHVQRNGKFGWIKELAPPIDTTELMEELRADYGPGDYVFRVMVDGKRGVQAQRYFSIAANKKVDPTRPNGIGDGDIFRMMMESSNTSRQDQQNMMAMMMQQQQASADRQMQMMMSQMQGNQALITALLAGKDKPTDMIAALAQMQGAFGPKQENGLIETMTLIKSVKELFGDAPQTPEEGMIGLAKTLLPAIGSAVSAYRDARTQAPNGESPQMVTPQISSAPVGELIKPTQSVLTIIQADILYAAARGYKPDRAAELIADTLEDAEVPESDLFALVATLQSSTNWIEYLAEQGIDLRERAAWANQVISSLVELYTSQNNGADTDSGGAAGIAGDPEINGETIA